MPSSSVSSAVAAVVDMNTTPPTPAKPAGPTLQRTLSLTSSSAIDQLEKDIDCCSESSSSYTDVNQAREV